LVGPRPPDALLIFDIFLIVFQTEGISQKSVVLPEKPSEIALACAPKLEKLDSFDFFGCRG
jgi:hypothetical protein